MSVSSLLFENKYFRSKKSRFPFFVTGALSAFLLTGVLVLNLRLTSIFQNTYRGASLPNGALSVSEREGSVEELQKFLSEEKFVRKAECYERVLVHHVEGSSGNVLPFAYFAVPVKEGEQTPKGEIHRNFACGSFASGEEVSFQAGGGKSKGRIVEIIPDPINGAPELMTAYLYGNKEELQELKGEGEEEFYLTLWLDHPEADESQILKDYHRYFGKDFAGSVTSFQTIMHNYLYSYRLMGNYMVYLLCFLLAFVCLLILLLMNMELRTDQETIRTLKILGFTGAQIRLNYLRMYGKITAAGALLGGGGMAILLRKWLNRMFDGAGGIRISWISMLLPALFALVIVLLLHTLLLLIALHRISSLPLTEAEHEKTRFRVNHLCFRKCGASPKLLPFSLGMRDAAGRRSETVFILVVAVLCTVVLLSGIFVLNGVFKREDHLAEWGFVHADIYVARKKEVTEEQAGLLPYLNRDADVDYVYAGLTDMVSYQLEGEDAIRQVSADVYYRGFPEKEQYAFFEGGNPTSTDEIAVGINFAKRNHLRVGSVLHLLQKGEKKSYTVTGIYPSYRNQANSVRFFVEDIFSYFDSRMTGYYTIVLKDPRSQGRVIQDLSKKYPEFDFYPMTRSTSRTVNKLIPPVILSVCMVLLLYRMVLHFLVRRMDQDLEQNRDIQFVLGFTKRQIRRQRKVRFQLPELMGTLLALALSGVLVAWVLRPLANELGLMQIPYQPSLIGILATAAGILLAGTPGRIRRRRLDR